MTTSLSITLDRSSLSLSDLVIYDSPAGTTNALWVEVAENPDFLYRYGYAPDSAFVAGKQLLTAVLDQATLPLTIWGQATSSANLATLKASLVAALGQFNYDVTVTLDGAATTYSADCSTPAFGPFAWGQQQDLIFTAALSIPVNPIGAP